VLLSSLKNALQSCKANQAATRAARTQWKKSTLNEYTLTIVFPRHNFYDDSSQCNNAKQLTLCIMPQNRDRCRHLDLISFKRRIDFFFFSFVRFSIDGNDQNISDRSFEDEKSSCVQGSQARFVYAGWREKKDC
jgi:hypothetical protein